MSKKGHQTIVISQNPVYTRFEISDEWIDDVRKTLPEFPKARRARYVSELDLSEYDAAQLTASKETADFFREQLSRQVLMLNLLSNWLQGEVACL